MKFSFNEQLEFIFNFFKKKGCSKVFSIVGGHALYLNAAQHKIFKKDVIYFHNEQSLSLAAIVIQEYLKTINSLCNAILQHWTVLMVFLGIYDNIPLIVISGQPRNDILQVLYIKDYDNMVIKNSSIFDKNIVKRWLNYIKKWFRIGTSKFYQTAITGRPTCLDRCAYGSSKRKFVKKIFLLIKKQ